jgi:NADH:ubiquinone oxidoreductase subunit 3 (subunit A)
VPSLISDYLPLVVFIALGALISGAAAVAPFLVAYKSPDPRSCRPTNAASTRSTMRA